MITVKEEVRDLVTRMVDSNIVVYDVDAISGVFSQKLYDLLALLLKDEYDCDNFDVILPWDTKFEKAIDSCFGDIILKPVNKQEFLNSYLIEGVLPKNKQFVGVATMKNFDYKFTNGLVGVSF